MLSPFPFNRVPLCKNLAKLNYFTVLILHNKILGLMLFLWVFGKSVYTRLDAMFYKFRLIYAKVEKSLLSAINDYTGDIRGCFHSPQVSLFSETFLDQSSPLLDMSPKLLPRLMLQKVEPSPFPAIV